MVVKKLIRIFWKTAKSKILAASLILGITVAVTVDVFLLAGRWVPAVPGAGSPTGKVYEVWWFQILVMLLLANLVTCITDSTIRRIKSRRKNAFSWSSTIFHLGLAIVLIGTLATGQFRTMSTIKLIQGETKEIPYRAITSESNVIAQDNDMLIFALQEQRYELDSSGNVKDIYSLIAWGEQREFVGKNEVADRQQFSYRGIYMFPSTFGYAVGLSVTNSQGDKVAKVVIPLDTAEYAQGVKSFSKTGYRIDPLPKRFSFNFYPDIDSSGSRALVNKSFLLNNPGLFILAEGKDGSPTQKLLHIDESIELQGYRVTFTEIKPWSQLTVVYDPGAKWVFAGIIIAITGLFLFIFFQIQRGNQYLESELPEG